MVNKHLTKLAIVVALSAAMLAGCGGNSKTASGTAAQAESSVAAVQESAAESTAASSVVADATSAAPAAEESVNAPADSTAPAATEAAQEGGTAAAAPAESTSAAPAGEQPQASVGSAPFVPEAAANQEAPAATSTPAAPANEHISYSLTVDGLSPATLREAGTTEEALLSAIQEYAASHGLYISRAVVARAEKAGSGYHYVFAVDNGTLDVTFQASAGFSLSYSNNTTETANVTFDIEGVPEELYNILDMDAVWEKLHWHEPSATSATFMDEYRIQDGTATFDVTYSNGKAVHCTYEIASASLKIG